VDFDSACGCGWECRFPTKAETKMEGERIDACFKYKEYPSRWNLRSNNADKSKRTPAERDERSLMVAVL
jgi:hypothetical protein